MSIYRSLVLFSSIVITLLFFSCGNDQLEEVDCSISGPSLAVSEIVDAGCLPTGRITLDATGGNGQLLFSLDGINFQASPTFGDLSSDNYTITVVDESDCTDAIMVTVDNESSDLTFTAETTTGGCEANAGTIIINASGGTGGYTYRVGTGVFGTSNIFENISGGMYNVSVQDDDGCIYSSPVRVESGISFTTVVKPILDTNCNLATCHGDDPGIPRLGTFAEIEGVVQKIRSEVEGGTMPPEDTLSQANINEILCWISDGAPNN